MIALITVNWSASRASGGAGGILTVVFHNGRAYDHPGVPYAMFEALLLAESKGVFYNQHIRGRYN